MGLKQDIKGINSATSWFLMSLFICFMFLFLPLEILIYWIYLFCSWIAKMKNKDKSTQEIYREAIKADKELAKNKPISDQKQ